MKMTTKNLALSAMFLALGLVLPFLTGQLPQMGTMLLPMHLPVLLCGMFSGWEYGAAVGLILPLLRSVLFGMPPIFPTAVAMTFELAAYGAFAGLLYRKLSKTTVNLYVSLILAMLLGRAVWGVASFLLYSLFLTDIFTPQMFLAGAFLNAWPGIVIQIAFIPLLLMALQRMKPAAP
jgi:thiamine transporter ThiT